MENYSMCKETLFALLHGWQIIIFLDMFLEFQHWGPGNNMNQIQISISHRCTMLQLPPAQAMAPTI